MIPTMRRLISFGIALAAPLAGAIAQPTADTRKPVLGDVTVCYFTPNCSFAIVAAGLINPDSKPQQDGDHPAAITRTSSAVVDAPAFQITNTGKLPMTSVVFYILADASLGVAADKFKVGTISPGNSFVVIPGLSNDDRTHTSTQFFFHSGSALDTSDSGPNANAITFEVTGIVGGAKVTTGKIVAGATVGPSNDKTVSALNFLGGPGNADGPCNDCVGPKVIGKIR